MCLIEQQEDNFYEFQQKNYPNTIQLGDIRNKHESETALDKEEFDYVIDNNGTLEELKEKVKEILIKEGILWRY